MLSRSRKNIRLSARGHSRTDRSSRASVSGTRRSEDSFCLDRQVSADPAVIGRALQRRRILEELINTEESYIGDVRFLMNACRCLYLLGGSANMPRFMSPCWPRFRRSQPACGHRSTRTLQIS
jgi:hypothetical protein